MRNGTRFDGRMIGIAGCVLAAALSGCGFRIEPDPEFMASQGETPPAARSQEIGAPVVRVAPAPPPAPGPSAVGREGAIVTLIDMTASPTGQVRANAIEGLSRAGARGEPVVALGLRDENPGVRSVSAAVAGRAGMTSLLPSLRTMTGDESAFVRASVIGALRALGDDADPTELSKMLLQSPDPRLRAHAAFVIGEMGDPTAIPMLKQAYASPIRNASEIERRLTRLQIAEAMVKLGDDRSIDGIRAALYPARPEELEATALAVQIIGQIRDRGSIDQLIYLADPKADRVMPAEVRLAVAGALARMGMTEGGFTADEFHASQIDVVRAQAASVYGRTGRTEHLPKLEAMLHDPSELVRVSAAAAVVDLFAGGARADAKDP